MHLKDQRVAVKGKPTVTANPSGANLCAYQQRWNVSQSKQAAKFRK